MAKVQWKTQDELRNYVKTQFNGEYATRICTGCGTFCSNIDGDYRKAEIIDSCAACNREEVEDAHPHQTLGRGGPK